MRRTGPSCREACQAATRRTAITIDRFRRVSSTIFAAALGVLALRGTCEADVNRTPMAVPVLGSEGTASVYPSTLTVAAIRAPAETDYVGVALYGVTHPCPQELAVLLVHNDAEKYLLMANAGGCQPLQARVSGSPHHPVWPPCPGRRRPRCRTEPC